MSGEVNNFGLAKINYPRVSLIILNWNDVVKFIEVAIQIPEPFSSERRIVCKLFNEHSDNSKRVFEKIYELSKK